jgi:hypothetical protein
MVFAAVLACTSGDDGPPTDTPGAHSAAESTAPEEPLVVVDDVQVGLPESPDVHLVRMLSVSTAGPTRLTVVLDDGEVRREVAFPELTRTHVQPLLGLLADHAFTVEVTLTTEAGAALTLPEVAFSTPPLSVRLPRFELVTDTGAGDPGVTLLPLAGLATKVVVGLDLRARPVWALTVRDKPWALSQLPGGELGLLLYTGPRKLRPDGSWVVAYDGPEALPFSVPIPGVRGFNHEATPLPGGGFLLIHLQPMYVPDYPTEDLSGTEAARINDAEIVEIDAAGSVVHVWSMAELLDPTRIGFGSHESRPYDWAHANAVVYDAADDAILVSLRHQDAVVKFDRATGALRWILGNHDGWPAHLQPYLLEPVGNGFSWPYHQHAPMVHPTDDDLVVLFDNGNDFRRTPYDPVRSPFGLYSRVVAYRIDEEAMTIDEEWSFVEGDGPDRLFSQALGNADWLAGGDHVLATFSYLKQEGGVSNRGLGRGDKSIRAIEFDAATRQPVWDLRVWDTASAEVDGWQADRVIRVPSLYGDTATERILTE